MSKQAQPPSSLPAFDRHAGSYEQAAVLQRQSAQALLQHWLALGLHQRDGEWLDMGAGTGWLTGQLRQHLPPDDLLWALDNAAGMLTLLPDSVPGIRKVMAPMQEMPFATGQLSGIVSNFALHWAGPWVMAELARVLRRDGHALIHVPVAGSLQGLQQAWPDMPIFAFASAIDWQQAAAAAGLQVQQAQQRGYQQGYPQLRAALQALKRAGGTGMVKRGTRDMATLRQRLLQNGQPVQLDYQVWQAHLYKT